MPPRELVHQEPRVLELRVTPMVQEPTLKTMLVEATTWSRGEFHLINP
jgi:hypothetical protein